MSIAKNNYLIELLPELQHTIFIYLDDYDLLIMSEIIKIGYKFLFQLRFYNLYKIIILMKSKDNYLRRYSWKDLYFNTSKISNQYDFDNINNFLNEFTYNAYNINDLNYFADMIYSYKLYTEFNEEFIQLIHHNNYPEISHKYYIIYNTLYVEKNNKHDNNGAINYDFNLLILKTVLNIIGHLNFGKLLNTNQLKSALETIMSFNINNIESIKENDVIICVNFIKSKIELIKDKLNQ